ncbi:hypothetical protein ACLB2K_073877 [Fragaria x ananassa]
MDPSLKESCLYEEVTSRLSLANKRNSGEKTMHHHTGSSPIIYTMEELRIQGEELPIIKGFEKTYVRAGDEATTKHYVNRRKDVFKKQHPDVTEEEIVESVQSQQIEVLGTVLKTRKGKEIRGMGRAGERDLSLSSNGSTSRSCPPRVDEQKLLELQDRYEQRLKESEERAQQKYQNRSRADIHTRLKVRMSLHSPPYGADEGAPPSQWTPTVSPNSSRPLRIHRISVFWPNRLCLKFWVIWQETGIRRTRQRKKVVGDAAGVR